MKKLFIFAVFLLIFAGCQKENFLETQVVEKSEWETAAQAQGLHFIYMPAFTQKSLEKTVLSCTELISVSTGGRLSIENNYESLSGQDIHISANLRVPPYAVDSDVSITMGFANELLMTNVELTFGPNSFEFNKPAYLNVNASGLDLSALSPNDELKLMCYDKKAKNWEIVDAKLITFDIEKGEIKCIDGELTHFSRYGFTR